MAGWQNINDFHSVRPVVCRVMQAVYRSFDSNNVPVTMDHWWNSPSMSYQVDQGATEPSIVILNLREGEPDHPAMNTHFTINLNTQRIHDKFRDVRFPAPAEILEDLETLRNRVRQEIRADIDAEEQRVREIQLREEKRRNALLQARMDYYNRLIKNSLVDGDTNEEDWKDGVWIGNSCVLCDSEKFSSCNSCQIVSCHGTPSSEDYECPGSEMDGIETCVVHPSKSYCRACRDISGENGVLTPCPSCEEWHCRQDQAWCKGRPVPTSTKSASGSSPKKGRQKIQRKPQHPLKPEPCETCIEEDEELFPFMTCGGGYSCWSSGNKVCEECAPEGGMQCSNEHEWYCDDCAGKFDGVWECPGCEKLFCHRCPSIKRCYVCASSSLCGKCTKDAKDAKRSTEGKNVTPTTTGAQLNWTCAGCDGNMCTKCESKTNSTNTCDNCSEDVCDECADVDECCLCKANMCMVCREKTCNSCDGIGGSKMEDMMQEMDYSSCTYDGDDEYGYYDYF